jgi:hypothetical protein
MEAVVLDEDKNRPLAKSERRLSRRYANGIVIVGLHVGEGNWWRF